MNKIFRTTLGKKNGEIFRSNFNDNNIWFKEYFKNRNTKDMSHNDKDISTSKINV